MSETMTEKMFLIFEGVKVVPYGSVSADWLAFVREVARLDDYPMTLGQMMQECGARGHLMRICKIDERTVWFDHDDLLTIQLFQTTTDDPSLLASVDRWRQDIHGDHA